MTSPWLAAADTAAARGRWTPGRKEHLLTAIRRREITFEAACSRYDLSAAELAGWVERFARGGRAGLCETKLRAVGR